MRNFDHDVLIRWEQNVSGWKRGDQTRVTYDDYIRRLESNGLVSVVESYEVPEPAENASKAEWAEFLHAKGYRLHPQLTRRKMIGLWRGTLTAGELDEDAGEESSEDSGEGSPAAEE